MAINLGLGEFDMVYRTATVKDIKVLSELRKKQLVDEGIMPDKDIDNELINFFKKGLCEDSLVEWVGIEGNTIVATAAIIFYNFPPTYTNKSGIKGYITNMYTAPEYRGQGIATLLLDKLVEEAKSRKVEKIWLSASKMGCPVYLKYGFKETEECLELNNICRL